MIKRGIRLLQVTILLITAVFFCENAFSQRKNVLKVNLAGILSGDVTVLYERGFGKHPSMLLGLNYTGFTENDIRYRGFGAETGFRWYFSSESESPEGIFVSPAVQFQRINFNSTVQNLNTSGNINTLGLSALIGYQKQFNWFDLDVFVGPEYNLSKINIANGNNNEAGNINRINGINVRYGVAVGFAFR